MGRLQKDGPPVALVRLVWEEAQAATSHSWQRYNTSLRKALQLAIGAGFKFTEQDFRKLEEFRPGYWMGADREWVYSMAVAEGNTSAAQAWEKLLGRKPIICDNVSPAERYDSYAHMSGPQAKGRIHVGCTFKWKGCKVKVTSFNAKGAAVATAPGRRFVITPACVVNDRREAKERKVIHDRLLALVREKKWTANAIFKTLGVSSQEEYEQLPHHVLEARAAEIQ